MSGSRHKAALRLTSGTCHIRTFSDVITPAKKLRSMQPLQRSSGSSAWTMNLVERSWQSSAVSPGRATITPRFARLEPSCKPETLHRAHADHGHVRGRAEVLDQPDREQIVFRNAPRRMCRSHALEVTWGSAMQGEVRHARRKIFDQRAPPIRQTG